LCICIALLCTVFICYVLTLRSSFLNILNNENQIFSNLSESEKLSYILNPSTPSQVSKLGSFFKKVIRTEDRGLLTYLLENVDFMFSLLHVYLYNLYNCHKLYCLMTIQIWNFLLYFLLICCQQTFMIVIFDIGCWYIITKIENQTKMTVTWCMFLLVKQRQVYLYIFYCIKCLHE
jgi:hypothetical protein